MVYRIFQVVINNTSDTLDHRKLGTTAGAGAEVGNGVQHSCPMVPVLPVLRTYIIHVHVHVMYMYMHHSIIHVRYRYTVSIRYMYRLYPASYSRHQSHSFMPNGGGITRHGAGLSVWTHLPAH